GTKGKAEFIDKISGVISGYAGENQYRHRERDDPNPYQVEHDELLKSIKNGGVINDLEHSAKSTLTAIMGRYSTYSGQIITWDEALNSKIQLMPDRITLKDKPPVKPDKEGFYKIAKPGSTEVLKETWLERLT